MNLRPLDRAVDEVGINCNRHRLNRAGVEYWIVRPGRQTGSNLGQV